MHLDRIPVWGIGRRAPFPSMFTSRRNVEFPIHLGLLHSGGMKNPENMAGTHMETGSEYNTICKHRRVCKQHRQRGCLVCTLARKVCPIKASFFNTNRTSLARAIHPNPIITEHDSSKESPTPTPAICLPRERNLRGFPRSR